MIFDERFGEIPRLLAATMRRAQVTPSEFYMLEDAGLSFDEMVQHIEDNSRNRMGWYMCPFPFEV